MANSAGKRENFKRNKTEIKAPGRLVNLWHAAQTRHDAQAQALDAYTKARIQLGDAKNYLSMNYGAGEKEVKHKVAERLKTAQDKGFRGNYAKKSASYQSKAMKDKSIGSLGNLQRPSTEIAFSRSKRQVQRVPGSLAKEVDIREIDLNPNPNPNPNPNSNSNLRSILGRLIEISSN